MLEAPQLLGSRDEHGSIARQNREALQEEKKVGVKVFCLLKGLRGESGREGIGMSMAACIRGVKSRRIMRPRVLSVLPGSVSFFQCIFLSRTRGTRIQSRLAGRLGFPCMSSSSGK